MRYLFGGTLADWTFSADDSGVLVLAAGATVTFWSSQVGGARYTDLVNAAGTSIDTIVSGDGAAAPLGVLPSFQGPPEVPGMWADAGGGARFWMPAANLGETVAALTQRVEALELAVVDTPARLANAL